MPYFHMLGFEVKGYRCSICMDNSWTKPIILPELLVCFGIWCGNHNLEGRIMPQIKAISRQNTTANQQFRWNYWFNARIYYTCWKSITHDLKSQHMKVRHNSRFLKIQKNKTEFYQNKFDWVKFCEFQTSENIRDYSIQKRFEQLRL